MTETGRGDRILEVIDTSEEFGKFAEMRQRQLIWYHVLFFR